MQSPSFPSSNSLFTGGCCFYNEILTDDSPPSLPSSPGCLLPDPVDDSLPNWRDNVQDIPVLSSPRPRALTPSGFHDVEEAPGQKPMALYQTSPWFKVPANIRRDILRLAFGDRRLHIGVSFKRAHRAKYKSRDAQEWRWDGSFCQRRVTPYRAPTPMTSGANHYGPWTDACNSAGPLRRYMGIMGWLLSCRQNYAETIDVLYSTNTIAMSGEAIISHINRLLLPQRLASITSLEIRWSFQKLSPESLERQDFIPSSPNAPDLRNPFLLDLDHLTILTEAISPQQFPCLRRLYISFEKELPDQAFSRYITYTFLLQRLREFVKTRPKPLDECAFAFPPAIFQHITTFSRAGWKRKTYSQVWDSLDGNLHSIKPPYKNSYPDPPFHLENRDKNGFWILEGCEIVWWVEYPRPYHPSSDFGTPYSPRSPIYSPQSPPPPEPES
ncbi:hypothetical protein FIE12Z_11070 [Fusarium flagelliforme]|uniref:DUF7730 domain-containing protein n=1 Tax=Fusarium flagelliforme TaxID=2675880 RepID=A0A395M9X0_9HYPO|nr:hypothetical protein FIE12Z_11070 [Fusarium flagelliforme]